MKRSFTSLLRSRIAFLVAMNIAVFILLSFLSPYFLNFYSLLEMTRFGAVLVLIGIGETLVFVSGRGGIDLSVGSMLSLSVVFFGTLVVGYGIPVPVAVPVALAFGLVLGGINGLLITVIGIPPFIATVSTLYAYQSLALFWAGGKPIDGFPSFFGVLGQGTFFGVPNQILFVVVPVALLLIYVVSSTIFGRSVYLIGINDTAAGLSGVKVRKTRVVVYALSGLLAAAGAIINASWLMSARPDAGDGLELQAITVAVLGGAAITGGEGSLSGTLLAVFLVTMISFGLRLAGIDSTYQLAVLGMLLISTVALNQLVFSRFSKASS